MARRRKEEAIDWVVVEKLMREGITGRLSPTEGVPKECKRAREADQVRYKELSERVRKEEQAAYARSFRGE